MAIDYFGRTAGIGARPPDFEYTPHVRAATPDGIAADTAAAADYLRSPDHGENTSVFTVGFCFGGGASWRQSADTPGLAGAIGFYGRPASAMEVVDQLRAPLLMLVAGADKNISVAEVEALAHAATTRGVEADVVVYPEAPHSFFDRTYADHREACEDAWRQLLAFLERHG